MNITNVSAGPYKGRGGRTGRSSMKKHQATLMSLGKPPKSLKATADEVTEPASEETAAISLKGANSPLKSLPTEGQQEEPGSRRNLGAQEQESCVDIAERIGAAGTSHCPVNGEKETEDLGPYEWLDSEIKRLEYALRSQAAYPCGRNEVATLETANEAPSLSKERGDHNGEMGRPKRVAVHYQKRQSSSSNGCSTNEDSNGEWCNSFSPVNSRFEEEEWFDWDWTSAGDLAVLFSSLLDQQDKRKKPFALNCTLLAPLRLSSSFSSKPSNTLETQTPSPLHHMPLRLCKPKAVPPFLSNSSPIPINNIKRRSLKAYLALGDSHLLEAIFYGDEKTILNIEAKVGTIEKENRELLRKVSSLSVEITSGKEKYIRLQADFDNFRRRSDKERVNIRSDAQGEVIESLLPMVDSFERAKQQIQPETEKETKNKMQKS
ncbi:hypothetical protein OIU78_005036 [Salix suchowensis]|nr:hypothetical protein OIU78_005036 [Salix suchowensis]